MNSRFEEYVHETLADGVKARRDELKAALDSAQAELDTKVKALQEIVDEAGAEADRKIRALAKKWGWKAESDVQTVDTLSLASQLGEVFPQARKTYRARNGKYGYWYDETSPLTIAQQALVDFDAAVEKAARRLVVVKKDLGMKAEAFDRMMAEAIEKLLKQGEAR